MQKYLLSFAVVLCLVGYLSAGPIPVEFQDVAPEIRKTCLAESGSTNELVERAGKGDFADDPTLKCYLKCLLDQFRLVTPKGIHFDGMIAIAPGDMKKMAIKLSQVCNKVEWKEGDLCDLAYQSSKCFYNTFPEEYFIM